MEANDIVDIVIGVIAIIFSVFYIVVLSMVVKNREYEFNRLWRTRLFLCVLAVLFTVLMALSNLRWIAQQIANLKTQRLTCSVFSYLRQCFVLPIFLSLIASLALSLVNAKIMETEHPNRFVIKRALLWAVALIVVGLVNIFVSIFKNDLTFFVTFDENEGHCIESPFYAVVSMLFSLILMSVVMHCTVCAKNQIPLNNSHRGRMRTLVFLMIPFCIIAAASIAQEFVSGAGQLALKYLEAGLYVVFMGVYVGVVVLLPTREARKAGLIRGYVTNRHGEYLTPEPEPERELENLNSDHEDASAETEESSKSPPEEVL